MQREKVREGGERATRTHRERERETMCNMSTRGKPISIVLSPSSELALGLEALNTSKA